MNRSRQKKRSQGDRQAQTSQSPVSRSSFETARYQKLLAPLTAALVGGLLVIAFLVPADAKSVFLGEALPQNLGWLLAGVLAALAALSNRTMRFELALIDWAMLVAGSVWLILSCIFADDSGNGRAAWNGFWQMASLASCYAIVAVLSREPRFARAIVAILLACGLAMSIHGIHQVTVSLPQERAKFSENPDAVLRSEGIDAPPGSAMRKRFEDRLQSNEPFATFALANSLGTLLSATLILGAGVVLSLAAQSRLRDASGGRHLGPKNGMAILRIVVLAMTVLFVAACWILTKSRASYVAVAAAGVVWFALESINRRSNLFSKTPRIGLIAMILVVLGGLTWMLASDRLVLSEAPKSLAYRLEYWQATAAMIADHWLFGVGLGNFQSYYPQYKFAAASEIIADPHNWFLDLAATTSIPVAGLITVWLFRTVLFSRRRIQSSLKVVSPWTMRASLIGAAVGWILCVGLLQLTRQAFDWEAGVYAWIAAVFCVFLLLQWIDQGTLPEHALLASILAMVIGLLASGSWQASGVGIPLMCLLGIRRSAGARTVLHSQESIEHSSPDESDQTTDSEAKPASWIAWHPVALALCGLLVFMLHSWRPTTESWTLLQQSLRAVGADEAIELAQRAAAADPLDPAPRNAILQMTSARLSTIRDAAEFRQQITLVDEAVDRLLKNDSASHLNWQLAGNTALDAAGAALAFSISGKEYFEQAAKYYAEATIRYPSSVQLRVQLATVLAALGDWQSCKREVEEAYRLSDLTPHADQMIENQLIWLPTVPPGMPSGVIARPKGGPNWANAEPVATWLRTR